MCRYFSKIMPNIYLKLHKIMVKPVVKEGTESREKGDKKQNKNRRGRKITLGPVSRYRQKANIERRDCYIKDEIKKPSRRYG
jgi:hypothetical protein